MKNMSFGRFMVFLSVVLAALSAAFLWFVNDRIGQYDDNQLDNFMAAFVDSLKNRDNGFEIVGAERMKACEFDKPDASVKDGLAYLAARDSLTVRACPGSEGAEQPAFDVYDGDMPLLRVTLTAKGHLSLLGCLAFDVWEVKEVALLKEGGLYDYEISVPNGCEVEVNGRVLKREESPDSLQFVGLAEIEKRASLTYPVRYQLNGMLGGLDIKVSDREGQPLECEMHGTGCFRELDCKRVADEATAKTMIHDYPDIRHMVRQWSLYMSHDQHGGRQGFDNIEHLLIEGTYLYIYSLRWSESVDITYVSNHGWDSERFTNERVCNFDIYSDKEFACDVYLQKNLKVGGPLPEKLAERIHFVYYNDMWKIVSMVSTSRQGCM